MDLIKRREAVEAVNKALDKETILQRFVRKIAIDAIKEMPSAQPKWIPCSERLPRVREWVLCQCRAGIMDVLRLTEDGSWNKNYPHAEYMSGFVTAWMPLPKLYKGEGGEMNDLISRQALCRYALNQKDKSITPNDIMRFPSAQPERKKGKWIYNSPVTMKCNQCGLVIKDWDWHRFKYCPNCAANMREDGERK